MTDFAYEAFKALTVAEIDRNIKTGINENSSIRQFGGYTQQSVKHYSDEELLRRQFNPNNSPDAKNAINAELRERGINKGIIAGIAISSTVAGTALQANATNIAVGNTIPKVNKASNTIIANPTNQLVTSSPPQPQVKLGMRPNQVQTTPQRTYPPSPSTFPQQNSGYSTPYSKPSFTLQPTAPKPYLAPPSSQG